VPTLANMMGFTCKYCLGNDIFTIKDDNIVVFPNGNFLTNKVYYNNTKGEYKVLSDVIIDEDYITKNKKYTENILNLSNNIIVHDLIRKEVTNLNKVMEEK
jgi:phosphoglycerol transferase MdoB-like AlkP superfamily enzyme